MNKILLFLPVFIFAQVIKFAPLPTDTANSLYDKYQPMLEYLSKNTKDEYKFVYIPTYKELLNSFQKGEVDMIILGALPYLRLKQQFSKAKAIVTFLNKYKKPYYRCEIITSDKAINSLNDIDENTKIFLTNKLSTCGYLMTQYMFKKAHKNLDDYNYKYVGSHVDVVFNTTLYNNSIGDVKSSIATEYKYYIKVIDKSIKIPEFSLIVNENKISKEKINKIALLLTKYNKKIIITPKGFYDVVEKVLKKIEVK